MNIKTVGLASVNAPCAMFDCEHRGIARDPRPTKVGIYYLCASHLRAVEETASVGTYQLYAANGRAIRRATMVTFDDGRLIKFTEYIPSKRQAIREAFAHQEG